MQRILACLKPAPNKHIQRAWNAHGTYSKRICQTSETRRASRKFLSMFIFYPKRSRNTHHFSDVQRRAPDVHQGYPTYSYHVLNVSPTGVRRIWNFAIFFNPLGARFTYTLMCDFTSNPDAANMLGNFRKFGRFPVRLWFLSITVT